MRTGSSAVELPVFPLISLLDRENLGDPHPVLAGGEGYVSHRFARDTERWLDAELAGAGLADRTRLADFTGMLRIIQRAQTEFYGWVTDGGETYSVLVAAQGRNAFALTRRGDRVGFRRISPDRLPEALWERLPDAGPGRGESISVREGETVVPTARPVLRRASGKPKSEQARRLDALLRIPRRGGAKLYAARRDDKGRRIRSGEWLDLLDLPDGRWVVHTTAWRGERSINAVPATPRLVTEKLNALLRTAQSR